MKDVSEGEISYEFVRLKSKMYSTKNVDGKASLFGKKVVRHKMKRIQSKKHEIETYEIKKISLSRFDDKRFVLDDGIHTLAYFHKDFLQMIKDNKTFLQMIIKKKKF